jgi:hypothetical protein
MRMVSTVVTIALATATLGAAISLAYAESCKELWYKRNSYYKEAGYCFKTTAAINAFGNAGCQYDNESDLPLSAAVRARIDQIIRAERASGCR